MAARSEASTAEAAAPGAAVGDNAAADPPTIDAADLRVEADPGDESAFGDEADSRDEAASQASALAAAINRLASARQLHRPCAPVRDLLPVGDIAAAYLVQSAWIDSRLACGARLVGRKIGLTNPAVQAQLGVDQPDFGALLDTMDCPPGIPIDTGRVLQPKIEAEIAFVLAHDLDQPADGSMFSPAEVAAATDYVVAALEIVDSRIAGWDISIVDTVADNASSGLFVLGEQRHALGGLDLADCTMTMDRGSEVVSSGSGAACLGNPLNALAWLATTVRRYGGPLRAGEIVLSGALGPMVPVAPGDTFHAQISGIGEVRATFAEAGS